MWLVGEYLATTMFSLKPAWATSSGGKTLLLPTPFALKMGLLNVVFHTEGAARAEEVWPWLRDRQVAFRPAEQAVVNNTFTRIWKKWDFKGKKERKAEAIAKQKVKGLYPLQPNIGYREYVHFEGSLGVALSLENEDDADYLSGLMAGLNYLGKRGGFFQLTEQPSLPNKLPDDFIRVDGTLPAELPNPSVMQQLDECEASLSFAQVNIYTNKRITLHKDRLLLNIVLPYEVRGSSRNYTWYVAHE